MNAQQTAGSWIRRPGALWLGGLLVASLALGILLLSPPRNLLLICIDTVRADQFYSEQLEDSLSPWLADAQTYTQAVTVAPWTLPTLATVFTGLYPPQHGAGEFPGPVHDLSRDTPTPLSESADTLAEILAAEGYSTGLFSAHPWLKGDFGLDQGFAHRSYHKGRETLSARLLEWIDGLQRRDFPFFGYLHLMESHDLHRKPEADIRALIKSLDPATLDYLSTRKMPGVCRARNSLRCLRAQAYQVSVLETRKYLASLLVSLAEQGLLKNTLVVVFSDHGEAFRERRDQHRELQEDPRGMYGTGHGQYQFQEMLHIPLLAWVPGLEGRAHTTRVSLVDLFPSLMDWLGLDNPISDPPGRLLDQSVGEAPEERALYASSIAYGPETIAVISGHDKAMYWPHTDRFLFFDLARDPDELQPLETETMMLQFSTLAGDYLELPRIYSASAPDPDQELLRDLQSIGYLQGAEEEADEKE